MCPVQLRRIPALLREAADSIERLSDAQAVRLRETLVRVAELNRSGVFPAALSDHFSKPLAAEAQKFAQQFPSLLESWPVYRVTELGRRLTRAGMEIEDDEP